MLFFVCVSLLSRRAIQLRYFILLDNLLFYIYRLFISHIPNWEPFREIQITEVDYLGRYQLGRKTEGSEEKAGIFTGLPHSR